MTDQPIIDVRDLRKYFPAAGGSPLRSSDRNVHAVDGVSFQVRRGEVLGLVGESGCGKSTLALTLMGLELPTSGHVVINGQDMAGLDKRGMKALRREVQMVFQDPYESINPRLRIGEIVAEPLVVHFPKMGEDERRDRVVKALEDAGLRPGADYLRRLPGEISGGQRQRVVIAGALVLEPSVLLADEPVSMLDVSIRAEILNLLNQLRQDRGISVLFITHDLGTVGYIADRIAVMYLGRIVEIGETKTVLEDPQHPYTKALLSVVPVPNPRLRKERIILSGETPNPIDLPPGCRFHPRCPIAKAHCTQIDPEFREIKPGYFAACHEIEINHRDS